MAWPEDNDNWGPTFSTKSIREFYYGTTSTKAIRGGQPQLHGFKADVFDNLLVGAARDMPERHKENTQKAYISDERVWIRFNKHIGHHPDIYSVNYPGDKLVAFVQWRATTNAIGKDQPASRKTTIRNVRGITAKAMEKAHVPPHQLPVTSILRNPRLWARIKAIPITDNSKLPIRAALLSDMIESLRIAGRDGIIRKTIWSIAHNTMRRGSEVLQEATGGLSPSMIYWENGGHFPKPHHKGRDRWASIHFDVSKTNKNKKPQTALMWCRCKESRNFIFPCALCALCELYRAWPHIGVRDPLCRMKNKDIYRYRQFLGDVQVTYKVCTGRPTTEVGTHSFRKGGYQDAKKAGHSDEFICSQAYWANIRGAKPYEEKMQSFHSIDARKRAMIFG